MTKQEREERKLQRMKELKQIEDELHASGIKNIAGIDEVEGVPSQALCMQPAWCCLKSSMYPG